MRISDDVRKFAEAQCETPVRLIAIGMQEKAREFREAGGEIYVSEITKG